MGTHVLERKGIKSQLNALSNGMSACIFGEISIRLVLSIESPEVSLHGGPIGFDSLPWTLLSLENTPELFSKAELARLHALPTTAYSIFRLESPSGDQGFPGSLKIEVCIALIGPENPSTLADKADGNNPESYLGSITIVYRAKLEGSETVTPVNLTQVREWYSLSEQSKLIFFQHWGFNLDASLQGGPKSLSVKDHELTIKVYLFLASGSIRFSSLASRLIISLNLRPIVSGLGISFRSRPYPRMCIVPNVLGTTCPPPVTVRPPTWLADKLIMY